GRPGRRPRGRRGHRAAAAPDGGPQGRARVEPAAAERTLAPGEPAPQPGAELAHQVARLGDVAGGEELERLLEQAPPPGGATAVLAPAARLARIRSRDGGARGAAALALLLGRLARLAARSTRLRRPAATGARHRAPRASAPAGTAPLPLASQRERRIEEAVEKRAVALVLHQRRRERLAQRLALHPGGRDRGHGVQGLGDRHLDAVGAQRLREAEQPGPHDQPRAPAPISEPPLPPPL